jgi:hypothetical protein
MIATVTQNQRCFRKFQQPLAANIIAAAEIPAALPFPGYPK